MQVSAIYIGWLVALILSCILTIILLASTIHHICDRSNEKNRSIAPRIKITSISYFVCYIIAFLSLIADLCLNITTNDDGHDIAWSIGLLFGGLAELVFYSLLIMRLYFTFIGTVYHTSKYLYYTYIIAIIFGIVFGLAYIGSVIKEINETLRVVFLLSLSTINLIIRLSLIILFIYKICSLIAHSNLVQNTLSQETSVATDDQINLQLIQTITKHLLLGSIAIACNTIALILVGIERLTRGNIGQKYGTFTYIAITLFIISLGIEMICAYLSFSYNDTLYHKWCSKCHNGCCHSIANRELARMSSRIQEQHSNQINRQNSEL